MKYIYYLLRLRRNRTEFTILLSFFRKVCTGRSDMTSFLLILHPTQYGYV
jgi:hypothetical protein